MNSTRDAELENRIATALAERAGTLESLDESARLPLIDIEPGVTRASRRRVLVGASAVAVAAAVVVVVIVGRSGDDRLRVAPSASEPSTTVAVRAITCPISGVSPGGLTRGTLGRAGGPPPDFVAVTSEQKIVGYLDMRDPDASSDVVYGCDLTTVVGHLVPNKGFIPIGVNPETVPTLVPPQDLQRADQCMEEQKPIAECESTSTAASRP